jgi:5'-nucleotidase
VDQPIVLLTNDDGFHAPGLSALREACASLGRVVVVAPDRERSGVGRMISLGRPLRAIPRGTDAWSVDGTPTDCVYLAVHGLLPQRPDLVISGINRGPNLAEDTTYSGTVAGAMEAAMADIPAMAVSLGMPAQDYRAAADFARRLAPLVLNRMLAPRAVLNVNVPHTGAERVERWRWARLGRREYGNVVHGRRDPRGRDYYWIGGERLDFKPFEDGDCDAAHAGWATLTPLRLDSTDDAELARLRAVELPDLG